MILSVSNIHKSFSEKVILENISFHLEDYDKAALVGINGVGKTTLLRIICSFHYTIFAFIWVQMAVGV